MGVPEACPRLSDRQFRHIACAENAIFLDCVQSQPTPIDGFLTLPRTRH